MLLLLIMMVSICTDGQSLDTLSRVPKLNNHLFSKTERPTFIGTYVDNTLGIGFNSNQSVELSIPILDTTYNLTGEMVFATLNIEYQQKVKEWMAMRAEFGLNARIGANELSLITEGFKQVNYTNLGWLFKLHESSNFYISGHFYFKHLRGNYISIIQYLDEVFDPNLTAKFSKSIASTSGNVTFNLAWAPTKVFAFVLNNEIGYGNHIFKNIDVVMYNFHIASDFDLFSKWKIPLGLYLGYERNNRAEFLQKQDQATEIIHYNLYFTGSTDFNLTLGGNSTFSPFATDKKLIFTNVIFSLRVYFQ